MAEEMSKEWYEEYAKEHNLVLGKTADKIIEMVKKCDKHCPCKYAIWQKTRPNELEKIICPCEDHMKEIAETGHCHCRLFFKEEN